MTVPLPLPLPPSGRRAVLALCLILPAACAAPPPYVYRENEFDRGDDRFNRPLDVTDGVTVCYNSQSTSPGEVRALAEAACRDGGGRARFVGHVYEGCPLLLVSGAHFSCGLEPVPTPGAAPAPSRRLTVRDRPAVDASGHPATPSAVYRMNTRGVGP